MLNLQYTAETNFFLITVLLKEDVFIHQIILIFIFLVEIYSKILHHLEPNFMMGVLQIFILNPILTKMMLLDVLMINLDQSAH